MSTTVDRSANTLNLDLKFPEQVIIKNATIDIEKIKDIVAKQLMITDTLITPDLVDALFDCNVTHLTFKNCKMKQKEYNFFTRMKTIVFFENCHVLAGSKTINLGFMNFRKRGIPFHPDAFHQRGYLPEEVRKKIDSPDPPLLDDETWQQIQIEKVKAKKMMIEAHQLFKKRQDEIVNPMHYETEAYKVTDYHEAAFKMKDALDLLEKLIDFDLSTNEKAFLYSVTTANEKLKKLINKCKDTYEIFLLA